MQPHAALLRRRRPRARDQQPVWALHVLATAEDIRRSTGDFEFETDRAQFSEGAVPLEIQRLWRPERRFRVPLGQCSTRSSVCDERFGFRR